MTKTKQSLTLQWIIALVTVLIGLGWITAVSSQSSLSLIQSEPLDQARGVSIAQVLQLQFDQKLSQAIQSLTIETEPETPLIFDLDDDRLLIQAPDDWDYSTDYTVTVPSQLALPLTQAIQLTFRSEPEYTYNRDIAPLLDAHCVACHRRAGRQPVNVLDTYEAVLKYVTPGSETSLLIDPRWTRRHANTFFDPTAGAPASGISPAPIGVGGISPAPIGFGPVNLGGATVRNPAIAYAISKGHNVSELGVWTDSQVDSVKTWIVQDQAAEDIES